MDVRRHPGAELIGPVRQADSVAALLGIEVAEVERLREAHALLAGRSDSGTWYYPDSQFADGKVLADLPHVLQILGPSPVDDWNVCFWLSAPKRERLDGLSPLEWMRLGRPLDEVLILAGETAARWSN